MRNVILTTLILISFMWTDAKAAEGSFFATASFDYQFDSIPLLRPGCNVYPDFKNADGGSLKYCTGNNPRAEFKLGYEFAFGSFRNNAWLPIMQIGLKHRSNWFTGAPFTDDKLELAANFVFLEFKIGGLR